MKKKSEFGFVLSFKWSFSLVLQVKFRVESGVRLQCSLLTVLDVVVFIYLNKLRVRGNTDC